MKFTTLMQVPSSKDGRLVKMLSKAEPRIAKLCGYQAKFVERSGRPLSHCFPKEVTQTHCFREDCGVCSVKSSKGPSRCQLKSVVYMAVCTTCDKIYKTDTSQAHKGRYIGETARTLSERAGEHRTALRRHENSSFMFKHWALAHPEFETPPPNLSFR